MGPVGCVGVLWLMKRIRRLIGRKVSIANTSFRAESHCFSIRPHKLLGEQFHPVDDVDSVIALTLSRSMINDLQTRN